MRLLAWVALVVLATACEVREREPARPEPGRTEAPVSAPSTPPPSEQLPSLPEPRTVTDEAPTVPPPGMKQIGQALSEAAAAAAEASAQGGTHCERAYNGAVAMARTLHDRMGSQAQVPDRARFLGACERLPADVQQCMNISYGITHQDECRRLREQTDPALMREVRELMGQGGG